MGTDVFSVRIRKELKEIVRRYKDVNWRELIERLIEDVRAQRELEKTFEQLDALLRDLPPSPEPGWRAIREYRDSA